MSHNNDENICEHNNYNVLNYAFYSNDTKISIVQNSIINFNNNIINTPGIMYMDGNIILVNTGVYKVTYYVQAESENQISLNLNNVTLLNSIYSSTVINSGIFLFNNSVSNSTLNLINSTANTITLPELSNNAYLLIEQLS